MACSLRLSPALDGQAMNDRLSTNADISAALSHVPAHDRDTWVRMAMAIKSELGDAGFPLWDDWSKSADNHNVKAATAVWKGIKPGGKVSIASLFHEAKANGWQPTKPYTPPTPEQRAALETERQAAAEAAAEIEHTQRAAAKAKALKLWDTARDVSADHPYLVAKGIKPEGVKQLRQMLVLPIKVGSELVNLQLIGEDGSKRFLTGGQVKGGSLVLGKLAGAAEAILCEGWATGLSLRSATGLPVVVAFNAGNLPVIAERLFKSLPALALTIAGDIDESQAGQKAAIKAAQLHGEATYCWPTFTTDQIRLHQQKRGKYPSDFNDLHQLAGLKEVAKQMATSKSLEKTDHLTPDCVDRVEIIRAADITPEPIRWLWDGWLARGKLAIMAGAPGTGKTTLAMAFAAAVTTGGSWPDGSRAKRGNVLIWSGEDDPRDTLVPRLYAAGADVQKVYFVGDTVPADSDTRSFDPARDLAALTRAIAGAGEISLMIVDPIVSAISGDSHKNVEVRRSLQPLVELASKLDCALVGISHFSKGTQGRDPHERVTGSIAFSALARVVLATAKAKDNDGKSGQILARAKSNIGPDHGGFRYDFEQTELANVPGVFASRVLWGDAVEGEARELLSVQSDDDGEGGALADAKQFLTDLLEFGPVPTKVIKADADGAGYSWATIRRAQKALGIKSTKTGMKDGWRWELPGRSSQNTEDAQHKNVINFGNFDHLRSENSKNEEVNDEEFF